MSADLAALAGFVVQPTAWRGAPSFGMRRPSSTTRADLEALGIGPVAADVSLETLSRWRIGGRADLVVRPRTAEACRDLVRYCSERTLRLLVVGHGSNLLFDDRGYAGIVMLIGDALSRTEVQGQRVRVEAGAWVPGFARRLGAAGLTGAEHIVGIPGTIGGLVWMNGGSLRRGIGENVESVLCVMPDGRLERFSRAACGFAYRHSVFQETGAIVLAVSLRFALGDVREIRRRMIEIMVARRRKFPLKLPNCGSVFVSDPAMYDKVGPPGTAIEACGLKGMRVGDAEISPAHANFIVNRGAAKAKDVLTLIDRMRREVHRATGFWLRCEVRHVAWGGRVREAHLVPQVEW